MLRLCFFGVVLFAISVCTEDFIRNDVIYKGSSHTISVLTLGHTVVNCYIDTPNYETFEFEPGDETKSTDKFTILNDLSAYACKVTINNIDQNDAGDWSIYYTQASGEGRSQPYHITVKESSDIEEDKSETVKLLTSIFHRVVEQSTVDITLNSETFEEECFIEPPNGVLIRADLFVMDNVKVQPSSKYVSCRISIGPVSETLLGDWQVCGKSVVNNEMRCQPVSIEYNRNSAQGSWDNFVHQKFSHPVHYGSSVNPGVLGNGNVITCHVITPNGEDLVITPEIKYPHIERTALENPSLCSVVITDIDSYMIGEWKLYGKFDSILGMNQVSLPLEFYLYNENDPYEQAYNVTVDEARHIVNLGSIVTAEVSDTGFIDVCQITTPSGQVFNSQDAATVDGITFNSNELCQISVGPISENMLGEWLLVGKFSDGELYNEKILSFQIIQEDPENPIEEEDRNIQYLQDIVVDTLMYTFHKIFIHTDVFSTPESCHLTTPDGLQYSLIDGFDVPNVEIINKDGVECGVVIHVANSDMSGEWTLISRTSWLGVPTERRQLFTINIEAIHSLINNINIKEGSNLYLRLEESISMSDSCTLYGPDGQLYSDYEVDTIHSDRCGYIVKSVSEQHNGTWVIQYGDSVINKATVEVTILDSGSFTPENLVWTLGSSVNVSVGPEDALYCKVEDVKGYIIYDGFGQCWINVERVKDYHDGVWTIHIGYPGSIVMHTQKLSVTVQAAEPDPVMTTSVSSEAPAIILTCYLPEGHQVGACKFRHPLGDTVIVQQGVGQDGFETEVTGQDCVLRLTSPTVRDLGLWRCAVNTEETTIFAFLTVTASWLMQDPGVAASVVIEPVLKQQKREVLLLEGEPAMLLCSIPASIRYCYFRTGNKSIINVGPAISSPNFEYIGSGLLAGDCGIRLKTVAMPDAGEWSCHVGLMDNTAAEQSAAITIEVQERMRVFHYWKSDNSLVVEAIVYNTHPLDYCRFVRITGQGVTQYNPPRGFTVFVNNGHCILYIEKPNIMDLQPWTVVAKLTGVDTEIAKSTKPLISSNEYSSVTYLSMIFLWTFSTVLSILMLGAAIALIPKKNREWTYNRASNIRNSLRINRPAPVEPIPEVNTPRSSIFKEPLADPPKYQDIA